MKRKNAESDSLANLRMRAEDKQKKSLKKAAFSYADADREKLIQEMQIHQIELEMQNEELTKLRNDAEVLAEKYIDVYDFSPICYMSLDTQGVITMANLTAEKQFGTNRIDLIGKSLSQWIAGQSLNEFDDFFKTAFRIHSPATCELALDVPGKPPLIVQVRANISSAGDECRLALMDITERKKIETELRATKDYLRIVYNNAYDAIFVHDLDGKIVDVNDKMLEMYKVKREEALGYNSTSDYSVTDEFMEVSRANWKMVMSGVNVFFERKARRPKDGSLFDVEVFLTKLALPDGDYILANVRDITERKRIEKMLQESEEQYRQFFKTSRDFTFVTSKEGKIVDMNDAALELFGYLSLEELRQMKISDLYVKPKERDELYNKVLECGYIKEYPADMRRKDGSIRQTLITAVGRYEANGRLAGLQGTIRDVTEQRRNEEELRKYREELEIMVAKRTRELEDKTKNLEEVNTTLNVLLQKREKDRKILEENFVANIGSLVLPFLEKIKKNNLDAQQQFFLDTVEKNLEEITSPLLKNIQHFNLTPREVQIAYLIKDGKTTKEIATVLGIVEGSIATHRKNIRKKLGLGRTSNLQSHLRFIE
ncbi:MAG: PAS domain S-box protein [Smithella sp.]